MATTAAQFSPELGLVDKTTFIKKIIAANLPVANNNKNISYYNVPAAFDIEVSSFYQNGEKRACMYVWQFGILNWVTYGRTWEEFAKFISVLSTILGLDDKLRLAVYIQNFGYEFQFMRKRIEWDKVFFLEERKPVYGLSNGVEYRDSLKLSSKSLEKMGKDLMKYKFNKRVGDLDYQLIRTSKTPLTEQELGYCEDDIRVLLAYIQEKIESDGDITRIPMTNTGYVRNFCRKKCFSRYKKYAGLMSELTIEPDEYRQLKRAFQGGFTHASAKYQGKVLENVGSYDFTSSYPAVMLTEKFPMSKSRLIREISDASQLNYYLNRYCCLMDITFRWLTPKLSYDHPMSISKCTNALSPLVDNGRVVAAESVTTTITEQDFRIYEVFYSWDEMTIHNFRIYEKSYLPKPFVQAILSMYKDKTTLKGVEGEEINYMISKNMLNAAYGMCVTDIFRDEIKYENDEYSSTKPDIDEAIDHYNKSKRRFLFYPWGVWVTAYARANLFTGIVACGNDYVYSDTDSIKVLHSDTHRDYINKYNETITAKLDKAAEWHHLDSSEFSPLNRKGEPKPIGVWDYEGEYDRFKTLGAKRYLTEKSGEYALTVAGLSKRSARDYLVREWSDPFKGFEGGLHVPSEWSGRLTSTYIDEPTHGVVRDYLGNVGNFEEYSSIHMEPSEYEITISQEYQAFLDRIKGIKEDSW